LALVTDSFTGLFAARFHNAGNLTIGTVDGIDGITANGGVAVIAPSITIAKDIRTADAPIILRASGGGQAIISNAAISNSGGETIQLFADRMLLGGGAIVADGGGNVSLQPTNGPRDIDLGSTIDLAAALELSDAELNTISTTGLVLVGTTLGVNNIVVTNQIVASSFNALALLAAN